MILSRAADWNGLAWPGYLWIALMFYLLVALVALEIPRLVVSLIWRLNGRDRPGETVHAARSEAFPRADREPPADGHRNQTDSQRDAAGAANAAASGQGTENGATESGRRHEQLRATESGRRHEQLRATESGHRHEQLGAANPEAPGRDTAHGATEASRRNRQLGAVSPATSGHGAETGPA